MDLTTSQVSPVYEPLDICDSTVSSSDQNTIVPDLELDSFGKTSVGSSRLLNSPDDMGIPNTWPEEEPYTAPNSVLDYFPALPAQQGFDEMPVLVPHTETAHYSSPVHSTLFSPEADVLHENDIKDPKAIAGTCGLRNLGNTCFMNAGLQCLLNNRNLVQFFLENYESDDGTKDSLCSKFAQLIVKVQSGNYSVIDPGDFKEALGKDHPQFRDYRQHDCQEFLALLLDSLHEHLNMASSKSSGCGSSIERRSPSLTSVDDKTLEADFEENRSPTEEEDYTEKKYPSMDDTEPKEAEPGPVAQLYPCHGSENSSHSASPHSTDSFSSWDTSSNFRLQPVPEDVKPFKDIPSPLPKISETAATLNSKIATNGKGNASIPLRSVHQNNDEEHCPIENLARRKELLLYKRTATRLTNVDATTERKPEKNELANRTRVNRKLPTIEDFVKDTKTLNTNVLIPEETNNQLKFDSEKFPKLELTRPRETVDNLTTLGGNKNQLKRVKDTNVLLGQKDSKVAEDLQKSGCSNLVDPKRMRMDSESSQDAMDLETNEVGDEMEIAGKSETCKKPTDMVTSYELDADKEWEQYTAKNQSVVVDTFQGQFQSTVVCSECGHVSVTYEPFMYLPVPLPHALERETVVTYIPLEGKRAIRFLITVHKHERVYKIKEALLECLIGENPQDIILAEVSDNCISHILDDNTPLNRLNDSDKQIFAFEVNPLPVLSPSNATSYTSKLDNPGTSRPQSPCSSSSSTLDPTCTGGEKTDDVSSTTLCISSTSWAGGGGSEGECSSSDGVSSTTREFGYHLAGAPNGPSKTKEKGGRSRPASAWHSCAICLEEMPDSSLRTHPPCQCILCHSCIEISCRHYGSNSLMCPVCSIPVKPEEFLPVNMLDDYKMKIRLISVPVVYRFLAQEIEEMVTQQLLGHPSLLRLPNSLPASTLYEYVDKCVPFLANYSLHFVDGQGINCSRCPYPKKCTGCEVSRIGDLSLRPGDNLAVTFMENVELTNTVVDHNSMEDWREKEALTLYDCLQAFSESETLDEHNPWFCPVCQRNQQAKKSLSIWRCPDTVMVYLKRFMFHEFASTKVDDRVVFPLEELDLSPFVSGPRNDCLIYNLQACICHYGGLSSGHYAAYCKHTVSGDWHYCNDDVIRQLKPQDEDQTYAYILFYQKPACSS